MYCNRLSQYMKGSVIDEDLIGYEAFRAYTLPSYVTQFRMAGLHTYAHPSELGGCLKKFVFPATPDLFWSIIQYLGDVRYPSKGISCEMCKACIPQFGMRSHADVQKSSPLETSVCSTERTARVRPGRRLGVILLMNTTTGV